MRLGLQSVGNYTKPALFHYHKVVPGERYKETIIKKNHKFAANISTIKKKTFVNIPNCNETQL